MKTPELLSALCNAANAMTDVAGMIEQIRITDPEAIDGDDLFGQSIFLMMSHASSTFRDLYDALPEALKTERTEEIRRDLYPHKSRDQRYAGYASLAYEFHSFAHGCLKEMSEARKKFDL